MICSICHFCPITIPVMTDFKLLGRDVHNRLWQVSMSRSRPSTPPYTSYQNVCDFLGFQISFSFHFQIFQRLTTHRVSQRYIFPGRCYLQNLLLYCLFQEGFRIISGISSEVYFPIRPMFLEFLQNCEGKIKKKKKKQCSWHPIVYSGVKVQNLNHKSQY